MLTLVAIRSIVVTVGALALDVTVCQELVSLFIIILFRLLFLQFAFFQQFLKKVGSQLFVRLRGGTGINIKANSKLLEALFNHRVIAVYHILWRNPLFLCSYGDGYAMLVATTNKDNFLVFQSQIANINISRYIHSCQVSYVDATIGIRQGGRHGCAFELFLFHEFNGFNI